MRRTVPVLAIVLALAGCDADDAAGAPGTRGARAWPAGTVLAVDGRPITAQDVDQEAQRIAQVYPARSERFLRSQALLSFVLPREALRSAYPERRERAREECEALRARLQAGEDAFALGAVEATGGPDQLTLFLWDAARRQPPGAWSEPLERLGFFSLVQRVELPGPPPDAGAETLTLRAIDVAYTPPDFGPDALDAAIESARLEVVDPAWDELVPETLRYRMRGRG